MVRQRLPPPPNIPNSDSVCRCSDGQYCLSVDLKDYHRCQLCSTIESSPSTEYCPDQGSLDNCNAQWDPNAPFDSSSKNGSDGNTDCTDPTDCSEEDPTEMPSATPDMPSLPGSDSGSDAAAEETPSTTDRLSLPGSDSGSDAAAEETPSTTATPPLPGSDTPTVDAN